jgi:hypothetical protein
MSKHVKCFNKLFGLRNDLVHRLLTLHFFVWFVEWIELIHHHLIPYSYLVSTNIRHEVIPPNLSNKPMMHHHILDEVIPQTKHPLSVLHKWILSTRGNQKISCGIHDLRSFLIYIELDIQCSTVRHNLILSRLVQENCSIFKNPCLVLEIK